jgi:hypothetical protein
MTATSFAIETDGLTARPSGTVCLAMRALVATGRHHDGERLRLEATVAVAAVADHAEHARQVVAVMAVLRDTGCYDLSRPGESARLRRAAETVVTAVTTGRVAELAAERPSARG